MSFGLRSLLLCISALVGCSHGGAMAARDPGDVPAKAAISSQPGTPAAARENPVLTQINTGVLPNRAPSNDAADASSNDARATRTETVDDSDPTLRQRIRQAAMADNLL